MKTLIPYTSDMRYERTLIGIAACGILFFLALQFGAVAVEFAGQAPNAIAYTLQGPPLRFALLVSTTAGFFFLGLRFLLSAIQKIGGAKIRNSVFFSPLRLAGMLALRSAFACIGIWIAANLALRFIQ